jgi:hypothetical protein
MIYFSIKNKMGIKTRLTETSPNAFSERSSLDFDFSFD